MQPTSLSISTVTFAPTFNELPEALGISTIHFLDKMSRISTIRISQTMKQYVEKASIIEKSEIQQLSQEFIEKLISKLNSQDEAEKINKLKALFDFKVATILDQKTRIKMLKEKIIGILSTTSLGNKTAIELRFEVPLLPSFFEGLYESLEESQKRVASETTIQTSFALEYVPASSLHPEFR